MHRKFVKATKRARKLLSPRCLALLTDFKYPMRMCMIISQCDPMRDKFRTAKSFSTRSFKLRLFGIAKLHRQAYETGLQILLDYINIIAPGTRVKGSLNACGVRFEQNICLSTGPGWGNCSLTTTLEDFNNRHRNTLGSIAI
ncbi:hypothetical protein BV898_09520 [Hypsibius exemplaris]|uniref:Uncharacterized protein n=1 Tax=Hypsibius exemplaris TaxID=2072580 RepID=A0A1W0WME7_HYPEX|nr:hypothetical protein BV898_09520 [Hypsibius exemplaris]